MRKKDAFKVGDYVERNSEAVHVRRTIKKKLGGMEVPSIIFVIFGGAGDLTWRKLVPSLFDLRESPRHHDHMSGRGQTLGTTTNQDGLTPKRSGEMLLNYLPNTFFTSPTLFCTLPAIVSAVPRSRRSRLPIAFPVSSLTFPFAS